ncbi:hypothetical protein [Pedobacter caeni]|uniref:Uncharacterized protein n=1 Tax=Pedobacter caeni TaxID=288992 RepID=A0A1M4TSX6_9SPHI|nr:hypothetical protein [Pedobacter caeni]SHE47518.1 hypothetical protein SAMN04488522_101306 [Pedobacter caeni]
MLRIKYISFVALVLLLLFDSCKNVPKTPGEKAKHLIAQAFGAGENYTYQYEPGLFGKLDRAYSTYHDDSLYVVYRNRVEHCLDMSTAAFMELAAIGYRVDTTRNELKKEKLWKEMLAASAKQRKYNDSSSFYSAKSDSIKQIYKPHLIGWKIVHEYRANNAYGVQVEQKTTFYFDDSLTRITGPEEAVKLAWK